MSRQDFLSLLKANPHTWISTGVLSAILSGSGLVLKNSADDMHRAFKADVERIEAKTDDFGKVQAQMTTQLAVMGAGIQDLKEATKDVQGKVRNLELKMASK